MRSFLAVAALSGTVAASAEKPHIFMVLVDDWGWNDVGFHKKEYHADVINRDIRTPNIDKLAAQGVQFNRAYCQFPVCGPSRASLLSGLYATRTRFLDNSALVEREAADVLTLPGTFRRAGYRTVGNGKIYPFSRFCQRCCNIIGERLTPGSVWAA